MEGSRNGGSLLASDRENMEWFTDRCPNCGKTDWCRQASNSVFVCRRGPGDGLVRRYDRDRVPYWIFIPAEVKNVSLAPSKPGLKPADPKELHKVYATLLGWLSLSDEHRAEWQARGVSLEAIERHFVRTWPSRWKEKEEMATELYHEFGEVCRRVPGWYLHRGKPMLSGWAGWVLPMWHLETGGVCALRLRANNPTKQGKYFWISSGHPKKGGTSPGVHARLAWPGRNPGRSERADVVRITEGEAKSIVLAEHTGIPTISVPGVASWREALPWLRWLGAEKVLICFDHDYHTNPLVARALLDARGSLPDYGFTARLETWKKRMTT